MPKCETCGQDLPEVVKPKKHVHEFRYSYSSRIGSEATTTYYCPGCGKFKEEEGDVRSDRASNMGGETVKQFN